MIYNKSNPVMMRKRRQGKWRRGRFSDNSNREMKRRKRQGKCNHMRRRIKQGKLSKRQDLRQRLGKKDKRKKFQR